MLTSKKVLTLMVTVIFLISILLSGCGTKSASQASNTPAPSTAAPTESTAAPTVAPTAETLPPVELSYYTIWSGPTSDIPMVEEAMNKILKAKINATIKIHAIDIGSYDQKMNVINASGEPYDLAFTAPWINNYYTGVSKGVFLQLDDLLPKYAPHLWKLVPKGFWDAARVNGKLYAAQNYQIGAATYGFMYDLDFVKKVNDATGEHFDPSTVTTLDGLTPWLAEWKKANIPKSTGFVAVKGGGFQGAPVYFGFDSIGSSRVPGWVRLSDTSLKVVNQYDTPEFKKYIQLMRKFYLAGYIERDAAINPTGFPANAVNAPVFWKPGQDEMINAGGQNTKAIITTAPVITTDRAAATLIGISKNSKNPERALMYLDLMSSDKELYNLLALGIEGKHYVKVGDNQVKFPDGITGKNATYMCMAWSIGNQFLEYLFPGVPTDVWDKTIKVNETAQASLLLGFSFNPDPIKTEIAQVSTVLDEYLDLINTGTVNSDTELPKMLAKLKTAGVDTIIAEEQKQVDAWAASKSK